MEEEKKKTTTKKKTDSTKTKKTSKKVTPEKEDKVTEVKEEVKTEVKDTKKENKVKKTTKKKVESKKEIKAEEVKTSESKDEKVEETKKVEVKEETPSTESATEDSKVKEEPVKEASAIVEVPKETKAEDVSETKEFDTKEFEDLDADQVSDDTIAAEPVALEELGESSFDGRLIQLIGWIIVGTILSVVTLGLGIPFARCFIYDWQFKHTKINGKRLCFDGNGLQLLGNYIKWTFFSIITLGIFLIFLPVQYNKWISKHVHYEGNKKPAVNYSLFDGTTWGYIGVSVLTSLLNLMSLGLLDAFCENLLISWKVNHRTVDTIDMEFDGKGFQLLGNYIKWGFFSIITLGIYSLWVPIKKLKWEVKHTHEKGYAKHPYKAVWGMILPIIFGLGLCGLQIYGLTRVPKDTWVEIKEYIEDYAETIDYENEDPKDIAKKVIKDTYNAIKNKDFTVEKEEESKQEETKIEEKDYTDEDLELIDTDNYKDAYVGYLKENLTKEANVAVLDVSYSENPLLVVFEDDKTYILSYDNNEVFVSKSLPKTSIDTIKKTNSNDKVYVLITTSGKYKYYYFVEAYAEHTNSEFSGDKYLKINKDSVSKGLTKASYKESHTDISLIKVTKDNTTDLEKKFGTYVEDKTEETKEDDSLENLTVGNYKLKYGDYTSSLTSEFGGTYTIMRTGSYSYVNTYKDSKNKSVTIREVGTYEVSKDDDKDLICFTSKTTNSSNSTNCYIVYKDNVFSNSKATTIFEYNK